MKFFLLTLLIISSFSCSSQEKNDRTFAPEKTIDLIDAEPIGQYVVEIFQDSNGNLWYGTLEKGVAKFDGKKLDYLTTTDGLPSNRIVDIVEDRSGNLWFGTGEGLSKYNGKKFTNYSVKEGLGNNSISKLFIDSKENFWIGTWGGVYKFNGSQFENFTLPYPEVETALNPDTKDWITEITEDSESNIWFARDGYGASKYDGTNFSHFLKKDGLYSNNVTGIEIDKEGSIWFASRVAEKDYPNPEKRKGEGGITKLERQNYHHFPEVQGLNNADVYGIYKDRSDNLWISTIDFGVYKYNGAEFTNYDVPISIMAFKDDMNGTMWLGGAGGLYKIDRNSQVIYITTNGPWN